MEHLSELIEVFKRNGWAYVNEQTGLSLDQIIEKVKNEETRPKKNDDPAFRMRKFRLQEELLNQLFLKSYQWKSAHKNVDNVYQLRKRLLAAHFLLLNNSSFESIRILRSVSVKAAHFQQYLLQYDALSMLQNCYAGSGDTEKVEACRLKIARVQSRLKKESEAESLLALFLSRVRKRNYLSEAELEELRTGISYFERVKKKSDSVKLRYALARLQALRMEYARDDKEQTDNFIEAWKSVENHLRKNMHLVTPEILSEISVNLTKAYVYREQYEEALKMLRFAALYFIDHHPVHWFRVKQMEFTVLCWSRRMTDAIRLQNSIARHPGFNSLDAKDQAIWRFIDAQLQLVQRDGPMDSRKENISKWQDQVELLRSEKTGWNISVYLVEISMLCKNSNFEEALHRLDAFRKYLSKHVDTTYHYRVKCFYRLLVLFARKGGAEDDTKIDTWYDRLNLEPANFSTAGFEIIPYQVLWNGLLRKKPGG